VSSAHLDIQASWDIIFLMRTTLKIDDDLYQAAKSIAEVENKTVGQVVSALMRKAILSRDYCENTDDMPAFHVSENASLITLRMVCDANEDSE
jgi:hypothetical protein